MTTRPADPRGANPQDMIGKVVYFNGWKLGVIVSTHEAPFMHPGPVFVLDNGHRLRDIRGCEKWEAR